MTTITQCKRAAKKMRNSQDFVIVHTPGHVDETKVATDRGFTVLPINEVWNFTAEIDAVYTMAGKKLDTNLMKARVSCVPYGCWPESFGVAL
jgi:hypothetical protein